MLYNLLITLALLACSNDDNQSNNGNNGTDDDGGTPTSEFADIVSVSATSQAGAYRLSVGIASPDTGCERYADWWEVVKEDESLAYRRILAHSHVNEQPFTRSGGPIPIAEDEAIWIRAHMNDSGYGGITFFGSVANGFEEKAMPAGFAENLSQAAPQPGNCAF